MKFDRKRLCIIFSFLLVIFSSGTLWSHFNQKYGLYGTYYWNTEWQGSPWKKNVLDTDISQQTPDFWRSTEYGKNQFSVEWNGYIEIPKTDAYTFFTNSDDGSWLWIDDALVVDNGGIHAQREAQGQIQLKKGWHQLKIRYVQFGDRAVFEVFWNKDSRKARLPTASLTPQKINVIAQSVFPFLLCFTGIALISLLSCLPRFWLALFVILLPALTTSGLIYYYFNATLFDFLPAAFEPDEFCYWHETLTFSQVGFGGGYYVLEEQPARAQFSHFGGHGPQVPILYGSIGALTGWRLYSAPLINLVLLAAVLGILVYRTKPTTKQLMLLALTLLTFWPFLFYLLASLEEGLHYIFAIGLAAVFAPLLAKEGETSKPFTIVSWLFIMGIALVRFSWALLLLPFFLLRARAKSVREILWALVKAALNISVVSYLAIYLEAPNPPAPGYLGLKPLLSSFSLTPYIEHGLANFLEYLTLKEMPPLAILFRGQVVCLLVIFCVWGLVGLLKRSTNGAKSVILKQTRREIGFHLCNLGLLLTAILFIYVVRSTWGGYRVLAPHLFLTLCVLALSKRMFGKWLVGGVILTQVIFSPEFLSMYQEYHWKNFTYDAEQYSRFQQAIKAIAYTPNQNAWCNTLLPITSPNFLPYVLYPYELTALPAGIGSGLVIKPHNLKLPLKSKYLLIGDSFRTDPEYQTLSTAILKNVKLLSRTPHGNLYLNLDAQCP